MKKKFAVQINNYLKSMRQIFLIPSLTAEQRWDYFYDYR